MRPVLCIQPFHTHCLTCNRRQSSAHCLSRQIQQRKCDRNQYKIQTGDWQWRKADMQSYGQEIQPKPPEAYTVPSTHVIPCNHFHHNQPASSNSSTEICQKQTFSHTLVPPIPTKNFSQPSKALSVSDRGLLPLNGDFFPNTDKPFSESTKPAVHHLPIQSVLRHFTPSSSAVDTGILVGSHGHFCFLEK